MVKELGACLLFGVLVFGIAVFRETQVDERPIRTALATGLIAGGVIFSVLALGVYVLWRREHANAHQAFEQEADQSTGPQEEPPPTL
jgi:fluoride ion exporter CrcB/FEX